MRKSHGFALLYQFNRLFFCFLFLVFTPFGSHAEHRPETFETAKKYALKIFNAQRETLYCSCKFDPDKTVNLLSCQMEEAVVIKRARRVEWEHMMPASRFGGGLQCWRYKMCQGTKKMYKGRKCCKKIDSSFRMMESELYNLWPSVGLVNQARSNYSYATVTTKKPYYGCSVRVDKLKRQFDPGDNAKGIVARANLFMAYFYSIELTDKEYNLFHEWSKKYPPTIWEKKWANNVAQYEGYTNPFIS